MLSACDDENFSPKPRGYFRIELPSAEYENLGMDLPYEFNINKNAKWDPSKKLKDWGDVYYPNLKARLKLTYSPIGERSLNNLLYEGHQMAYEHTRKADGIEELMIHIPQNNVHGTIFKIAGDAATNTQFYVTDSTNHFLRGVVYFFATPNADSLRPLNDFMLGEAKQLIESLEWQN